MLWVSKKRGRLCPEGVQEYLSIIGTPLSGCLVLFHDCLTHEGRMVYAITSKGSRVRED